MKHTFTIVLPKSYTLAQAACLAAKRGMHVLLNAVDGRLLVTHLPPWANWLPVKPLALCDIGGGAK